MEVRSQEDVGDDEKMKIGWISAAAYAKTGYGRQTEKIVSLLIEGGYEVYNIGGIGGQTVWGGKLDYPAKTHVEDGKKIIDTEIPILPTFGQLGGQDVAQTFINHYKLDLIITLWDAFVIHYIGDLSIPTMTYLPVDTHFTENMYTNVKGAYRIIAFSRFGRKELLKWFPPAKVNYIPHGIDTGLYKPCSENEKRKTREELNIPKDAFMLINVGANVGERKQLPYQMLVFREWLKEHPDSYFFIFTNMSMPYPHGYDLVTFAKMLGIKDHIRYPAVDPIIEPYSEEHMARLYGASDLFWSMTLGEGFGLPLMEAQSCGTPAAITNCSTSPELVGGHGWLVETNPDYIFVPVWIPTLQYYPVASKKSALTHLGDAYNNPGKREEYGRKAREFALNYSWNRVMPSWFKLLEEVKEELDLYREISVPT